MNCLREVLRLYDGGEGSTPREHARTRAHDLMLASTSPSPDAQQAKP